MEFIILITKFCEKSLTNKNNEKLLRGVQGAPWHGGPIRDGFFAEDVFCNSTCTCNLHLSPLAKKRPPWLIFF